jgi:hypothetical protein
LSDSNDLRRHFRVTRLLMEGLRKARPSSRQRIPPPESTSFLIDVAISNAYDHV